MDKIDFEIIKKEAELIVEHFSIAGFDLITENKFPRLIFNSIQYDNHYFDLDKTKDNNIIIKNSNVKDIEEYSIQEQLYLQELDNVIRKIFDNYLEKRSELENKYISSKVKVTKSDGVKKRL